MKIDINRIEYYKEIKKNGSFLIEEQYLDELTFDEISKELYGSIYALLAFNDAYYLTISHNSPDALKEFLTTIFRFKDNAALNSCYNMWKLIDCGQLKRQKS